MNKNNETGKPHETDKNKETRKDMNPLRYFWLVILPLLFLGRANAQSLSPDVQAVVDACMQMRAAVGSGSATGLRQANKELKESGVQLFRILHLISEDSLSFDRHFVFDPYFVDSLLANRQVYRFAQQYVDSSRQRATSSSGKVFMDNAVVGGKKSVRYSLAPKGRQEIAVVTEPKGRVTLRIRDKTRNLWYNDTVDVTAGQPCRIQIIDLPREKVCTLEIEIINTRNRTTSFAIIGN